MTKLWLTVLGMSSLSEAEQVTVVVPMGNTAPDAGAQTGAGAVVSSGSLTAGRG